MDKYIEIGKKLKSSREQNQLTIKDVSKMVGLSVSTISRYENGLVANMNTPTLQMLSEIYNVNILWLLGKSDSRHDQIKTTKSINSVPLIGTIAAGTPILAEENIERYFNIDSSIKADFCLRIKGDSMINAGINNNDIVFIRQQPTLEIGEIGAIQIGEEATLKRFYRTNDSIILQGANSRYLPQVYTSESDVKVLGKLVATLHMNE